MNGLSSLLLAIGIYGLIELIKSCICKEKSAPPESFVPEGGIRFTHDRQDPTGYERHRGVGVISADNLREELRKEGFCEERINRFIGNGGVFICYNSFLI